MSGELGFQEKHSEDSVVVYLSGELDIYTAGKFKEKIYAVADFIEADLIIDCKELNYIDSTGLGIFVGTLKRLKQRNRKIYLSNLKENIKKLFMITELDKVFNIKE